MTRTTPLCPGLSASWIAAPCPSRCRQARTDLNTLNRLIFQRDLLLSAPRTTAACPGLSGFVRPPRTTLLCPPLSGFVRVGVNILNRLIFQRCQPLVRPCPGMIARRYVSRTGGGARVPPLRGGPFPPAGHARAENPVRVSKGGGWVESQGASLAQTRAPLIWRFYFRRTCFLGLAGVVWV